jgi:apolipoprotein D and lipocalin family protein
MIGEPREEIEMRDRRPEEVDSDDAVAGAVERERVGGGFGEKLGHIPGICARGGPWRASCGRSPSLHGRTIPHKVRPFMNLIFFRILAPCAAMLLFGACATTTARKPPLRTVAHVDLKRYIGDWRVIANIPYWAEKDCVDSIESYGLRHDGKIANWFRSRKGSFTVPQKRVDFVAEVVNHRTNAEWRVHFLPFVSAPYLIIDLDPLYQWTVVGHPSRDYGWIMARQKTMPAATYRGILQRLDAQGYDARRFVKVPQSPSQLPAARQ